MIDKRVLEYIDKVEKENKKLKKEKNKENLFIMIMWLIIVIMAFFTWAIAGINARDKNGEVVNKKNCIEYFINLH